MASLRADRTRIRAKASDTERPYRAPFIWITVQVPPSRFGAHGATETHFVRSQVTRIWTSRLIARLLRARRGRLGGERRELFAAEGGAREPPTALGGVGQDAPGA